MFGLDDRIASYSNGTTLLIVEAPFVAAGPERSVTVSVWSARPVTRYSLVPAAVLVV